MFVQTEVTPNPNSLKFLPGKKVSNSGPYEITNKDDTQNVLVRNLLSINGVEGIFLGEDFISINKIKKAKTDPLPMPNTLKELDERLEAKNLLGIYSSLTNSTLEKSVENFAGKNFSEFKQKLSEVLVDKIQPISTEIKKLLDDKSYLDNTLLEGVERADIIASKKIKRIKEIVGF